MVIAYHIVFSTYGFWLPNDPRGSNSDYVRSKSLLPYGEAKKVKGTRSVARNPHNFEVRQLAKEALKYKPVRFNGLQARCVGNGFAKAVYKAKMNVIACAILPDHVHVLVLRHKYRVETIVRLLKSAATVELQQQGLHPFQDITLCDGSHPSPWGQKYRDVYLFEEWEIPGKIEYVQSNPLKERKRKQTWSFVQEFESGNEVGIVPHSGQRSGVARRS